MYIESLIVSALYILLKLSIFIIILTVSTLLHVN